MLQTPIARNQTSLHFGLSLYRVAVLALALAIPRPASGGEQPKIPLYGERPKIPLYEYFSPEQLALEDGRPEDRIARYEAALAEMATATDPDQELRRRRGLPGFPEMVADFSALSDPEDAFAAAHRLTGTVGSRKVYEEAGVGLLRAARLARFAQDEDRALNHLGAARHAFVLADRARQAEGAPAGRRDFLYRAMVRLEEILVTDSEQPWNEAAELLARQLEVTPTGPFADWASRISDDPDTYVGEPSPEADTVPLFVGGDVRAPVKIFAPPPRYTEIGRKARVQGVVIIHAVIDGHGSVATLRLLKGLPMGLSEEAMRTATTWLFEPATLYGQPVTANYNLTLQFRL